MPIEAFGSNEASAQHAAASSSCVISSHARRRPRNDGSNRSSSGAQTNLKVYGRPASANTPIVRMSMPSTVSQACSVPEDSASGRPLANPSPSIAAIRPDAKTWAIGANGDVRAGLDMVARQCSSGFRSGAARRPASGGRRRGGDVRRASGRRVAPVPRRCRVVGRSARSIGPAPVGVADSPPGGNARC